jgi:hypothetical protein
VSVLVFGVTSPSWADAWFADFFEWNGDRRFVIADAVAGHETSVPSYITASVREDRPGSFDPTTKIELCEAVGASPCDDLKAAFTIKARLPFCATDTSEWCIEGISAYAHSQDPSPGQFLREAPGPRYAANSQYGTPAASNASLFRIPGIQHSGGTDTYAGLAYIHAEVYPSDRRLRVHHFTAAVLPYRDMASNTHPPTARGVSVNPNNGHYGLLLDTGGNSSGCVFTDHGICGRIGEFPEGVRARINLRVGNSITGWLTGRLQDPVISVTPLTQSQNRLVVDALPVQVPSLVVHTMQASASDSARAILPQESPYPLGRSAPGHTALDMTNALIEDARDTATALTRSWLFFSTSEVGGGCLGDKTRLLGIVTTNAMAYEGTAPRFTGDTLDYRVAGMHYNPDGSVFKGTYDLVMRSDVARCVYGFSKAPLKATISVTGDNGNQEVATTVVSEQDGWLKLGAYGFTFSSPTIKVRLASEQAAAPPLVESGGATSASKAKKKTITCVKGKAVRSVTAVKPKCPKGFRKR